MDLVSACLMFDHTKTERTEENYRKLYDSINATIDEDTLAAFVKKTKDLEIGEIIKQGNSIVESLALQVNSSAQSNEAPKEEVAKKEEVKVEEEPVVVDLFGGDDDFF